MANRTGFLQQKLVTIYRCASFAFKRNEVAIPFLYILFQAFICFEVSHQLDKLFFRFEGHEPS